MTGSTVTKTRRAADVIVARLIAHGVRRVFSVAGESFLDVLDALYDTRSELQVVTCRHEAAAANMAEVSGKLSGHAGVAFVTRGPGLTHASIGVHTAKQDASPMVLFVGEISREDRYRRAFQEVDLAVTFADLAKGGLQIDLPERAGEIVDRAFQLAESGRPGPVIVGLPEDVLGMPAATADSSRGAPASQGLRGAAGPGIEADVVERITARLSAAQRPLLWVGGSRWDEAAVISLRRLAIAWNLPVISSFRRKDLFANDHDCYAGEAGFGASPAFVQRLREPASQGRATLMELQYLNMIATPILARAGQGDAALLLLADTTAADAPPAYDMVVMNPFLNRLMDHPQARPIVARSKARFALLLKAINDARAAGRFPRYLEKPLQDLQSALRDSGRG